MFTHVFIKQIHKGVTDELSSIHLQQNSSNCELFSSLHIFCGIYLCQGGEKSGKNKIDKRRNTSIFLKEIF